MPEYSVHDRGPDDEPSIMRDEKIIEIEEAVAALNRKTEATLRAGMECLVDALNADGDYAWGWHCNIALAAEDNGLGRINAHKAASAFMKNAFGVNMMKNKNYIDLINSHGKIKIVK